MQKLRHRCHWLRKGFLVADGRPSTVVLKGAGLGPDPFHQGNGQRWNRVTASARRSRGPGACPLHSSAVLVARCDERGSLRITSNRPVSELGTVSVDAMVATAILDRVLERCRVGLIAANQLHHERPT